MGMKKKRSGFGGRKKGKEAVQEMAFACKGKVQGSKTKTNLLRRGGGLLLHGESRQQKRCVGLEKLQPTGVGWREEWRKIRK